MGSYTNISQPQYLRSAKVVAIFTTTEPSSDFVDEAKAGDFERVGVILDQIYDAGVLSGANFKVDVDSVDSYAGYVMHMGPIASGSTKVGDAVRCQVGYAHRSKVVPFDFTNNKALKANQPAEAGAICYDII
ncbi:hypothetical protein PF008_g22801 [Phytophthora fragariae]|uniref:Uncharacterized protein n=1 Tax=Phytophthora fragariae TaxID=53985 RepID=A0A6G0QTA8_9STRA|nr:hypothetical protein PF008_g22801 [Phytophthora fragariae]